MKALVQEYSVALNCGHVVIYHTHPVFAPKSGGVIRCSVCRSTRQITSVETKGELQKVRVR